MRSKIEQHHLQRPAYIYLRQSTPGQVRNHQQSTERQYALKDQALALGWPPDRIYLLDRDLGVSGARFSHRPDFQLLLAKVCNHEVGAVFALEASRLSRSSLDWHYLIEICSLTQTLVIDEEGCWDPADSNDALLLGLKGAFAQAEIYYILARLHGAKLQKARKGELRFPLPVGLLHDEQGRIVLDPDAEVQAAVRRVFALFRQTGSAYGVVQQFAAQGLRFPKRAYGGVWHGKLLWGRLDDARARQLLKNPLYAGAYVYGRRHTRKTISPDGQIRSRTVSLPMDSWTVTLHDHHEGYITWHEHLQNRRILENNRTNGEDTRLSGPAREGLALLQGLLLCGRCGRQLTVRYQGHNGLYPLYLCGRRKNQGLATTECMTLRCDLLDAAISQRVLEVLEPAQLEIALGALQPLEQRDEASSQQWRLRIERAEYEAQLAQRRYEEVDPSQRLVAATLERRWNDALLHLEELHHAFTEFQSREARVATSEQKARIRALAEDFPRLWHAPSTNPKDRKRMLRLLIKDITVERVPEPKQAILHIRWQGGACEDLCVDLPRAIADRLRYPDELVDRVRSLARELRDDEMAALFNEEGRLSSKGKSFHAGMIQWIRFKHNIPGAHSRRPGELSVQQVAQTFGVSPGVVYYWIRRGVIEPRRQRPGDTCWITLDPDQEAELFERVRTSSKLQHRRIAPDSHTLR